MKPAVYPITLTQGDGFQLPLTLKQSKTGPGIDLTGYTAEADIRRNAADPAESAVFSVAILDQTVPANLGKIVMSLTPVQTRALNGKYVYDLQLTPAAGTPLTYLKGTITIEPDVTR